MAKFEFGERTLGLVIRPDERGRQLFERITAGNVTVRVPFAGHPDPELSHLTYVRGPNTEVNSMLRSIREDPGLRGIVLNLVSIDRK